MSENKLTESELIKIFQMYLFGDCEVEFPKGKFNGQLISLFYNDYINLRCLVDGGISNHTEDEVKLIITPMSLMSDEDALIVAAAIGSGSHLTEESRIHQTKDLVCTNKLWNAQTNIGGARWMYVFQYLLSQNYAVPLWFGIDHWANGKSAIELEIAITKE